jgi:hypothetical protein
MVLDAVQKLRAQAGPDAWAQTLFSLEAAARIARELGDWELATKLAEEMRGHDPAYAGTEYALATVAEHNGDRTSARGLYGNAARRWSNADPDLPALRDAQRGARDPADPR